jgi:MOSC domain-containing protein YiiM
VIEPGVLSTGDPVSLEPFQGELVTAREMFQLFYEKNLDALTVRRLLSVPITIRARTYYDGVIAAIG